MEQPDQRESAAFSAVLMWLFKIEFGAHTVFRLRCSQVARGTMHARGVVDSPTPAN